MMKRVALNLAAWTGLAVLAGPFGAASASTLSTVYTFKGPPDATSQADLVAYKGLLYGASYQGGGGCGKANEGCGAIFSVNPKTGAETVLYAFSTKPDHNGFLPDGHMVVANGSLYGTTGRGGDGGSVGVVFRFDLKTGKYTVIHTFNSRSDGHSAAGPLVVVNNILYGATYAGPTNTGGTVYQVDLATRVESVLHFFAGGDDGAGPSGGVIYQNGLLYGTTGGGGNGCSGGCGTLFSVDPATGAETVLHAFGARGDGVAPETGLTSGNGILYGTTLAGGISTCNGIIPGCGTIFSYDPATATETVIYDFPADAKEDSNIATRPIYTGNALYGSFAAQDGQGAASVFKVDPTRMHYSTVVTFPPSSATNDLTLFKGAFFGCALVGSTGEVFKVKP